MSGQRVMKLASQTYASGRMAAWRAHTLGGVDETRLEWARRPALRSPTDLLVRVHSSSINPLDVAMLGGYGRRALGAWRRVETAWAGGDGGAEGGDDADGLPLIVGRDFAGQFMRDWYRAEVQKQFFRPQVAPASRVRLRFTGVADATPSPPPPSFAWRDGGRGGLPSDRAVLGLKLFQP